MVAVSKIPGENEPGVKIPGYKGLAPPGFETDTFLAISAFFQISFELRVIFRYNTKNG